MQQIRETSGKSGRVGRYTTLLAMRLTEFPPPLCVGLISSSISNLYIGIFITPHELYMIIDLRGSVYVGHSFRYAIVHTHNVGLFIRCCLNK